MSDLRRFDFCWDLVGDPATSRPDQDSSTPIEVYRLIQLCFRDLLERHFGKSDEILYEAGKLAGAEYSRHWRGKTKDLNAFVLQLQTLVREMGIGILRVQEADIAKGNLVITVSDDRDWSGEPEKDPICVCDEGFVAALLEGFTGKPFCVQEIDDQHMGERTCRFTAQVANG